MPFAKIAPKEIQVGRGVSFDVKWKKPTLQNTYINR
jgi:hypothetical protein